MFIFPRGIRSGRVECAAFVWTTVAHAFVNSDQLRVASRKVDAPGLEKINSIHRRVQGLDCGSSGCTAVTFESSRRSLPRATIDMFPEADDEGPTQTPASKDSEVAGT